MRQNKRFDFTVPTLVVGMGGTGLSCARYLESKACPFAMADSRETPPQMEALKKEFTDTNLLTGEFDFNEFKAYQQFIVSPGISIRSELFHSLQEQGCLVIGDIELFAQVVDKPVIAITGSNGKSTVVTLVEHIARHCGIKCIAGGNLGIPALDLLESQSDLYILELSSFQLETTASLKTLSATVLNVSEDHMDRYTGLKDYRQVKESIYQNTDYAVINRDEKEIFNHIIGELENKTAILFANGEPKDNDYGLVREDLVKDNSNSYRLKKGQNTIVRSDEIKLTGIYNYLNILAALALLEPLQLDISKQVEAIKSYKGLAHRCEWVGEIAGVQYYNDSKGTNTGATIAAINGFDADTILIAGGVGKDADFTELGQVIKAKIKSTVLMGVDSELIKISALNAGVKQSDLYTVASMQDALAAANRLAQAGDVILFSPACASFDMYQNYMKRGDDFKEKVLALKQAVQTKDKQTDGLKNVS